MYIKKERRHSVKGFVCFYKVLILVILTLIMILVKYSKIAFML